MLDPVATAPGSVTPVEQLVFHFQVESANEKCFFLFLILAACESCISITLEGESACRFSEPERNAIDVRYQL